jgi:polar amino acid transport system permease protein
MNFSWETFWHYLLSADFFGAALITIRTAVVAQTIGVVVGLIMALLGLSHISVSRGFSGFYVWLWRGTPLLAQLLILYFGLPQLGIRLSVLQAGLLGLSLNEGAFMTEIIRSGLLSVGQGQAEAAKSLGMSYLQALRLVILPQAFRVIMPPLGNDFNSMLRTTSLLSVISFEELMRATALAISDTFRPVECYSVAALYYLALCTTWNLIQVQIERRLAVSVGDRWGRRR